MVQPQFEDDESSCVACGARVRPESDRPYAISPERDLCYGCSVERGGHYDEQRDHWIVAPRLEPAIDLRDERL